MRHLENLDEMPSEGRLTIMTLAYFDCFSGISGDMTLGALVDAGVSIDALRAELARLDLSGYEIRAERVKRSGIAATKVHVTVDPGDRTSRNLPDIIRIIEGSSLSPVVRKKSCSVFNRLAVAEAKVHGTTVEHIHFHEVGAVDAIIDVVGSVIGFELLGITDIRASAINVGSGAVKTAHGMLPVPAPATAELLTTVPFYQSGTRFELCTPTGAAIISTLASSFGPLPQIRPDRVAYGAGDHEFPGLPNVLRLLIGQVAVPEEEDTSILIETNIDDLNPQIYGPLVDALMQQGAHDAYLTPIIMKKGRPAVLLSVLTDAAGSDTLLDIIFRETTSIGVRIQDVKRRKLSREMATVDTPYGPVRVKVSKRGNDVLTATPEFDDCRMRAAERRVPVKLVIDEAKAAWSRSRGTA